MSSRLFRSQVIEHKKQRIYGDVLLLPKFSHSLILSILFIWAGFGIVWLCTSTYARKETVSGWLEPPAGVVRLYPEITGTVEKIYVSEGSSVEIGESLLLVKTEALLASGRQLSTELLSEYESQRTLLESGFSRTKVIYQNRAIDIQQKIVSSQRELEMIEDQLKTIGDRHDLVKKQVQRLSALNLDGHVSRAELDSVLQQELALKSDHQNLNRNKINQKNAIEQLHNQQKILPDEQANALSQISSQLSDISQKIAQVDGQSTRILRAARSGIVNNLQAREGQQVIAGSNFPLLTLLPKEEYLTAHLLVPVRSAGFLATGQGINVRYDAFPYQKFGLYQGKIDTISRTILLPSELLNSPVDIREPMYQITAKLNQMNVEAYGQHFPLKPGMTLSADINLSERTLIQWLLEPVYSLKGRL